MGKIKKFDYVVLYFVDINSAYLVQNEESDFVAFNQLFNQLFMREIPPDAGVPWQVFLYNYNGQVLNVNAGKGEKSSKVIKEFEKLYKDEYNGVTILNEEP